MATACLEWLSRSRPALLDGTFGPVLDGLEAMRGRSAAGSDDLKRAIKRLQARKDRAYGAAWKRRGVAVSVLPNIARKVDRLEALAREGHRSGDEHLLDTAVDLYVYAVKYRLLLAEHDGGADLLPPGSPTPYSDHEANFDALVESDDLRASPDEPKATIAKAVETFEKLWPLASGGGDAAEVKRLVDALRRAARELVASTASIDPRAVEEFARTEASRAP